MADLSAGIAGGYGTKLLADAGATVVKLEPPAGDPLRRRTPEDTEDGALFRFLGAGKQSVVIDPQVDADLGLARDIAGAADVVFCSGGPTLSSHPGLSPAELHRAFPGQVITAISPFGLDGPWAGRPATEFTLQAWAGAIGWRGVPGRPPISTGGRIGEWAAGVYAATGTLAALRRRDTGGVGDLLDVAVYDTVALTLTNMHPVSYFTQAGRPRDPRPMSLLPGIHPTSDGWVGFMTVTGQQWLDFCVLIERFDWLDDESLIRATVREERRPEVTAAIEGWTSAHTTAEVLAAAAALRVPVAPIGDGRTVTGLDHFVDQQMFVRSADGSFVQPRSPMTLHGVPLHPPRPAPLLGEHTPAWRGSVGAARAVAAAPSQSPGTAHELPFAGLRIIDLTAFWAGPSASHFFALLGAEVIKVESPTRPDGMRTLSLRGPDEPSWWEHAPLFHATNTVKRGLGVRLDLPEGRELLRDLVRRSDVIIENFSPRVLDGWELTYEDLKHVNPALIVVRMPAFGLAGPWRDRTGFAQTMEQVSGMAWVTGYPDAAPVVPSGCCDPIAGAHGAFALELALEVRRRTGEGLSVEVPMVLSALNAAAEQVIEYTAYGNLMTRMGNRGPTAAPQNLYATVPDPDDPLGGFVAIAVETDEQWRRLCDVVPDVEQVVGRSAPLAARQAAADRIDLELERWCSQRTVAEVVDTLWPAGVPVGHVRMPHEPEPAQLGHRGFLEKVDHPQAPPTVVVGLPVRFGNGPTELHRRPAPTLGADSAYVVCDVLGRSPQEYEELRARGVVGVGLAVATGS